MSKARTYYLPDGRVSVFYPAPQARLAFFFDPRNNLVKVPFYEGKRQRLRFDDWAETEDEWYERCCGKCAQAKAGLESDDKDVSALPADRSKRNQWRGAKGQAITLDPTLEVKYAEGHARDMGMTPQQYLNYCANRKRDIESAKP